MRRDKSRELTDNISNRPRIGFQRLPEFAVLRRLQWLVCEHWYPRMGSFFNPASIKPVKWPAGG
jgi:hypothetical protein